MKKPVSLLLSLLMVISIITSVPLTVSAASTSDLTFELNEDGVSYCVSSYSTEPEGELIIPDTYNGLPVTKINDSAFYECKKITSVIIPNSVTSIGMFAFGYCESLSNIVIPDNLTTINSSVFMYTAFYNDSDNRENGVLYLDNYLIDASELTISDYVIKEGTKIIAGGAFMYCDNLKSVTIPDGVTSIGYFVFGCSGLTSITIPDSVTSIGVRSFEACKLTSIIIPDSVTSVGLCAFASCKNLTSIIIPDSVTSIDNSAFDNCPKLISVTIPKSVKNIGYQAFGYCYNERIENFTISSVKGTAAETYAKENDFKFVEIKKPTKPMLKKVSNIDGNVKVTWGAVEGADLYRVYRMVSGGEYEYIGSTTSTSYTDKNAPAGKTCRYIVKAKNDAGNSEASASLAIKHIDEPKLKTIQNTSSGVKITWGKVAGAEKYNVYRKVSGGEYKYIGATDKAYYTDKTAESGTKYYYAIRAKRDDSISSQSVSLSKYYLADPTLKTPTSTTSGIKLSWSKVTGAEGYIIYRKTGSGSYTKIKTEKGVSNLSYTDSSAKKGTKYTYKIKAYKSKTYSAYSNTKTITDKY